MKRFFNNSSIKLKIGLWYMGIMILLVFSSLAIVFYISENIIHSSVRTYLKDVVIHRLDYLTIKNGEIIIDSNFDTMIQNVEIAIYDKDFKFLYGNSPNGFEMDNRKSKDDKIMIIRSNNQKWYVYNKTIELGNYGKVWIRGVMPNIGQSSAIETVIQISFVILPFFLILSAIGGYIITKNAFTPIEKIRRIAEKINEGNDLSQRINLGKGDDELHTLANTFDVMFDRLQTSFENEIQFTSDVSHELRTPITVILTQAEYGKDSISSVEDAQKSFGIIEKEGQKMSKLVSQLLTLARMERGRQKLNIENINLSELLEMIIETQTLSANTKNIKFVTNIMPEIYASIDEMMIMRVFTNLISNAISYGKQNGTVTVELFLQENRIVSKISDDGIGISEDKLDKIWLRFYQVDPSKNGDNSGLGLSMVKKIVELHKGEIFVESELGKGTTFTIIL
ncbi:cell wall metabolism sensor histidine kinase WalK [Leptotrichia sp. oral taxon 879]|uniref:sensor histidine kinase n=1 Tax=Leptotrichia sp. oral taxon 879 TaxID=1227267 RepID=UPI0003ADD104|nr:HAMP domain-containing sensor histidine kinase [Leptotrichia sp. oral taxon 879]ERK53254.1 ATPase/histidine kinase/DNA gyrase B/HSP90 domain protein [Leptotrichia sp. oral taxon 879 str. F0557]